MALLQPERYFSRVSNISVAHDIVDAGFTHVLLDMDNTILSRATHDIPRDVGVWLATARDAGMLIIWFQNGWDEQYVEAGGPGSPNWHKSNALKTMRKRPELQGKLLAKGEILVIELKCPRCKAYNFLRAVSARPEPREGRIEMMSDAR